MLPSKDGLHCHNSSASCLFLLKGSWLGMETNEIWRPIENTFHRMLARWRGRFENWNLSDWGAIQAIVKSKKCFLNHFRVQMVVCFSLKSCRWVAFKKPMSNTIGLFWNDAKFISNFCQKSKLSLMGRKIDQVPVQFFWRAVSLLQWVGIIAVSLVRVTPVILSPVPCQSLDVYQNKKRQTYPKKSFHKLILAFCNIPF